MEFTKEQLHSRAKARMERMQEAMREHSGSPDACMDLRLAEIALAVLTAPEYIPPHVEDSMGDMCDGGYNAQGIWDLCRASIMPPAPCPRCGTISDRPDGAHYCHVTMLKTDRK